jgi:hypothetical protein
MILLANESKTKTDVLGPWSETDIIKDIGALDTMKHQAKTLCQIEDGGDGRPKNNWPKPQGGEVITNNLSITQNMIKLTTATM